MNQQRIPKSPEKRFQDLCDNLDNLSESVESFAKGRRASMKTILSTIRVLTVDRQRGKWKPGLLVELCEEYGLEPGIFFEGLEGIPESNPLSKKRHMTLKEYLAQEKCPHQHLKAYIWEIASQDALHPDKGLSPEIAFGEQLYVGGTPINHKEILSIGKNILMMGERAVNHLKDKYPNLVSASQ